MGYDIFDRSPDICSQEEYRKNNNVIRNKENILRLILKIKTRDIKGSHEPISGK